MACSQFCCHSQIYDILMGKATKESMSSRAGLKFMAGAIAPITIGSVAVSTPALPPPEDIPEEILRTEVILEARSPLDGTPLTAAEYDQLRETLAAAPDRTLAPEIQELIFLLQLRRVLKPVLPLLP
jgi:hypothetical protein